MVLDDEEGMQKDASSHEAVQSDAASGKAPDGTEGGKESGDEVLMEGFGIGITADEQKVPIIAGKVSGFDMKVRNKGKKDDTVLMTINPINPLKSEESPEWFIKLILNSKEKVDLEMQDSFDYEFRADGGSIHDVRIEVTAPHSVSYGERVEIVVTCKSKGDLAQSDSVTFTLLVRQSIMAIKTSIGHEKAVADTLYGRTKRKDTGIYSILAPEKLRGYVLVETINPDGLGKLVKGIKRARGVIEGDIPFTEIDHFLTPKPLVAGIVVGDIVELIAGPFKGEKARVQQIDESKEEITVELFEAVVPIPITIRGDHVRVLETEGGK